LDQASANPLHSTWSKPEAFAKLVRQMNLGQLEENEHENDDEEGDEIPEDSILRGSGEGSEFEEIDEDFSLPNTSRETDRRR